MKLNKNTVQGYSLIEVMFVVLILAIIILYASFTYKGFSDKAKIEEAARLAYEIRQSVDAHIISNRTFPPLINRTYSDLKYVERADTQLDSSDQYRINVYFKREAFPESSIQKIFTLYGQLINHQMDWHECGDACVKHPVDIPPAQPMPPAPDPVTIVVAPPVSPPPNPTVIPQPKPPVNPPILPNPPVLPPVAPPSLPEEPLDWKVTNINVLNVGKRYGKIVFITHFRDGVSTKDERIQYWNEERILNQSSSKGVENPVKEIIVKAYLLTDKCALFGSGPECWYEVGARTVEPAGADRDKYVCFDYGEVESPIGWLSIMGHEKTRCDGRKWRY
ncbi:type II secretion system protein [Kistimonas asteriae]|uniref:type II secretion system protein n=1 Tax=Kistimonas asteriae TaxID=517724 RepID=UPI001BAB9425